MCLNKICFKNSHSDQKENHLHVVYDMMDYANADPEFIKNIIPGDETWIYIYDHETKTQSSQ